MCHLITFPSGQITTLVNNIALIKPSGQCCYIVYYNNSTSQREDMGLGIQLRLGKCLHFLVCLCGCLHTSQGTVRFIFCDNLKFRSLFVMVIAFSRAGSLAVYKNFVDPFFFKGLNRDSSEDVLLMMMVEETFFTWISRRSYQPKLKTVTNVDLPVQPTQSVFRITWRQVFPWPEHADVSCFHQKSTTIGTNSPKTIINLIITVFG